MKSRGMKGAGHDRRVMLIKFWSENLTGRDHLENLGVDGKIT
jgi:hypothetical protein